MDSNSFALDGFSQQTPTININFSYGKNKRTLGHVEMGYDVKECFNDGSFSVCIKPETKRIVWRRDGKRIMRKMFRRRCKLYKNK